MSVCFLCQQTLVQRNDAFNRTGTIMRIAQYGPTFDTASGSDRIFVIALTPQHRSRRPRLNEHKVHSAFIAIAREPGGIAFRVDDAGGRNCLNFTFDLTTEYQGDIPCDAGTLDKKIK